MYEDKEVWVKDNSGSQRKGIVVSCEKEIGVSIVAEDDNDDFLLCLDLRETPELGKMNDAVAVCVSEVFMYIEECLENNAVLSYEAIDKIALRFGMESDDGPSAESCPFGA